MTQRSPLAWVGGKYGLAGRIIELFPRHTAYVEVFGGAAHVLFRKTPSHCEVYNDIDGRLVNFFRVVQDLDKYKLLCDMLTRSLYSRQVFDEALATHEREELTDVERAYCFCVINKQSFGSLMEAWGYCVTSSQPADTFARLPDKIATAHQRLRHVQVEHDDYTAILKRYDKPDTLFYLDPPYDFAGSRGKRRAYKHELEPDDHVRLVDKLLDIRGMAVLSGYDTPAYKRLEEQGWQRVALGSKAVSVNRKVGQQRVRRDEYVWVKG